MGKFRNAISVLRAGFGNARDISIFEQLTTTLFIGGNDVSPSAADPHYPDGEYTRMFRDVVTRAVETQRTSAQIEHMDSQTRSAVFKQAAELVEKTIRDGVRAQPDYPLFVAPGRVLERLHRQSYSWPRALVHESHIA
jgi:hypothetical protein